MRQEKKGEKEKGVHSRRNIGHESAPREHKGSTKNVIMLYQVQQNRNRLDGGLPAACTLQRMGGHYTIASEKSSTRRTAPPAYGTLAVYYIPPCAEHSSPHLSRAKRGASFEQWDEIIAFLRYSRRVLRESEASATLLCGKTCSNATRVIKSTKREPACPVLSYRSTYFPRLARGVSSFPRFRRAPPYYRARPRNA